MQSAQISLNKLRKLYLLNKNSDAKIGAQDIVKAENKFEAVQWWFKFTISNVIVWGFIKNETKSNQIAELIFKIWQNFWLDLINSEKYQTEENVNIPEEIELLAKQRLEAKQNKDYKKSRWIENWNN